MRSHHCSLICCLLLASCHFEASCGGMKLDMERVKQFVSSAMATEVGTPPTRVTCPESVKLAKGATFECTADYGGPTATLVIHQEDDAGTVTVASVSGIVIGKKAEAVITEQISQSMKFQAKVDCGEPVRAATAGSTFVCKAVDPNNQTANVEITVKDASGNVSFRLVPPT